MPQILLALDFLIPAIVFFLGRATRNQYGVGLKRESLSVFLLALLFAPILYFGFPLSVQGVFTASLLFLQSILIFKALCGAIQEKKE